MAATATIGVGDCVANGGLRRAAGARGAMVRVKGVELAYDDDGPADAPVVVCLHAIGHGARDFELLRERLVPGHRVVALDWPGQGASGPDGVAPSSTRYAELLAGFLEEKEIEAPILIGNSIGGAAALELVANNPNVARAVVIANAGGLFARGRLSAFVTRAFARFFAAGARGAWWFPRAFAAYYRTVLALPPSHAQRARIVASAREIAPVLAAAWKGFGDATSDLRPLAPRVGVPVMVAWGMGDRFNPLSASLAAIETIPRVSVRKYPAGHNPFLECVDVFHRDFVRFEAELPR